MSELLVARIVAAVFAAAAALGVTLQVGGVQLDESGTTKAVTLTVMALGSLYAALRTWRRGKLVPTSARAVDPKGGQRAVLVPAGLGRPNGTPPPSPDRPDTPRLRAMLDDIEEDYP